MGKLFKIEMKKLRKSTVMKVMLFVALGLSVMNVVVYAIADMFAEDLFELFGVINGYNIARTLAYEDSSDIMVMTVILMAVLIGGDFSARTLQTQVAAGFSRFNIIISRFLSTTIAYLVLYVLYFSITVVGVTLVFGFGDNVTSKMVGELVGNIFLGIIMAMTMLSLYILFAFLLKSTGGIIGVCVPFMLMGTGIITVIANLSDVMRDIMSFTPFGQSSLLNGIFSTGDVEPLKFILVCVVWCVGFVSLTYLSFRKAELK